MRQSAHGVRALGGDFVRPLLLRRRGIEDRSVGMSAVADQAGQNFCRRHGAAHTPLAEARRNKKVRILLGKASDIRHAGGGHAVLRRPVRHLAAVREQDLRRLAQLAVAAAVGILAGAVSPAAQQHAAVIAAQGVGVGLVAIVHPVGQGRVFQRQHIGTLLMHPRKIQSGEVDKGIMTGKNDLFRTDPPPRRDEAMSLHTLDRRTLVDCQ